MISTPLHGEARCWAAWQVPRAVLGRSQKSERQASIWEDVGRLLLFDFCDAWQSFASDIG